MTTPDNPRLCRQGHASSRASGPLGPLPRRSAIAESCSPVCQPQPNRPPISEPPRVRAESGAKP